MANRIYPNAKAAFMQGNLNLSSGNIKAVLVTSGYVYSATHTALSDILVGNRVATSANLTGKTFNQPSLGVFDADDVTFTAVTGSVVVAVVLYLDTGVESTSTLISYIDGRAEVQVAVQANIGATTVTIEDLPFPIASGAVMTRTSGSGPATVTTTAGASGGARSISVSSIAGSNLAAESILEYPIQGSGLPVTPNGGNIVIAWDSGASRIFSL
ncbi:hypothetical protein [Microcystis phage Mwe-JY26]